MRLSTMCLAVPIAYLVGLAGWRFWNAPNVLQDGPVVLSTPSEAQAPEGGAGARPVIESIATPVPLAEMRVTTPEEVREVLRITGESTLEDRSALMDAALQSEDPLVAGNAVLALGRLQAFSSESALLALVSDPRLRVRQDAVKACGLDSSDSALSHLEGVLEEGDPSVRPLALQSLGRIGGARAETLLRNIADDRAASRTDRVFARAALERMKT